MYDKNTIDRHSIVGYIADIFARRGADSYMGEQVSMAQHMLQAAQAARTDGADDSLVAAALLHDIGHYSNEIPDTALMAGQDNYHEEAGANFLAEFFPESVIEPIRQHVAAKRYLCAVDPNYFDALSEASKYTLQVQGGPMTQVQVDEFEKRPYKERCVKVRLWDDQGKDPLAKHPEFSHYRPLLESLVAGSLT